jgi:hypothetical protein
MVKAPATSVLYNKPDKGTLIIATVKVGPEPRVEAPRAHIGVQKFGFEEVFNIVILRQFAARILRHPEDGDSNFVQNIGKLTAQPHIPRVILIC